MDICGTGKGLSREIYPERIFDYYNEAEESFIGHGEMGKIATSAARAGSMLTKYISDKDWLDTLFSVYDRDECGRVPSSKLMELVKFTMSGNYEELEMMLDPMGCDLPIDMETFREIMTTWESKNGSSPDPSLLSNEISQLEFVNKKLVSENSKLELQVMTIEDSNNHLRKEIETLHNRIHTLQNTVQDYQDELKRSHQKMEDESAVKQYEFDQLKSIKLSLEQEIKEMREELINANAEISTLRLTEETLLNTSQEQDKMLFDAVSKASYYEEHYNQKSEEWFDIKEKFLDVLRSNEQLRREKRELEEELMKIHELQCIQEMRSTLGHLEDSEDEAEEEKDEGIPESLQLVEQDEEIELEGCSLHDITMDNPISVSTPLSSLELQNFEYHDSSLFAELVDSVSDDSFGQPMCGKRPKLQLDFTKTLDYPTISDIHLILENIQEVQCLISRVNADLVEKYKIQGALITSDKMTPKTLEQSAASQESHAEKKLVQTIAMDLPDKCNVELHDILSIDVDEFDLESELSNADNMLTTSLNNSADSVKDQFSKELKILRMQIAKSQAILTALSKTHKISRHGTTSQRKRKIFQPSNHSQNAIADIKAELLEYSPDHSLLTSRLGILANSHFNRYSTPATSGSQNSTPLHSHVRAKSCPILPSQTSLVTTGTQTEPLDTHIFLIKDQPTVTKPVSVAKPNGSRQWKAEVLVACEEDSLPQPYRRPKLSIPAIVAISDSEEVLSSPEVIRNRSSSFMKAIKHGSSALVQDTASGSTEPSATIDEQSPTPPDEQRVPNGEKPNELAADPTQGPEDTDDFILTARKLSILPEEDHEDSYSESVTTSISKTPPTKVEKPAPPKSVPQIVRPPSRGNPPPYRPPPAPSASRAYKSSENLYVIAQPRYADSLYRSCPLPVRQSSTGSSSSEPPGPSSTSLTQKVLPVRQSSDPYTYGSQNPAPVYPTPSLHYSTLQLPPLYFRSAHSLDHYLDAKTWSRSSGNPPSSQPPPPSYPFSWYTTSPSSGYLTPYAHVQPPPAYRAPPEYKEPPHPHGGDGDGGEDRGGSALTAISKVQETARDLEEAIPTSETAVAKKSSTGEGERQRKTGLNSIGKESQLKILISSKSEKIEDDEEDAAWRNAALVGSRRRRRGSTGSPGSSPAIQRSKAVDFGELESIIPSEIGPQPKRRRKRHPKPSSRDPRMSVQVMNMSRLLQLRDNNSSQEETDSDTDVDIKRDILEGMTQVATRSPSIPDHPNRSLSLSESRELKVRRRPTDSKARPLMPDLMENSETESAKGSGGSLESETESAPSTAATTTPPPPPATGEPSFPSIPDSFLKKLGLHKTSAERTEHLSEQEVENKFTSLSLAFKTDRFTLAKRLEIQQRQRDLAEKNVEEEIQALKENLNALSHVCCTEETRELVKRLHHHLEVLHQSTTRMSSRAEVYGAVQQEERMSKAIEVMVLYVENLKRLHDRTSQDLEDMKRIMIENNLLTEDGSEAEDGRRSFRTFSLSSVTGRPKQGSRRRASIAVLPRGAADRAEAKSKFMSMMTTAASRNSTCSIGGRRCSLIHNLRPFASAESTPTGEKPRSADDYSPLSHSLDNSTCDESAVARLSLCDVSSLPECQQQQSSTTTPANPPTQDQVETNSSEASRVTTLEHQNRTEDKIEPNNNNSRDIPDRTTEDEKQLHWSQTHLTKIAYQNPYDPSDHEDEEEGEEDDDEMVSVKKLMQACPRKTSTNSATSLFNSIPWMDNSCHLLRGFRYTVGGILLIAALLSLIVTFMPGQAIAQCRVSSWQSWHSLQEILQPYIALHHKSSPAT